MLRALSENSKAADSAERALFMAEQFIPQSYKSVKKSITLATVGVLAS